jgi:hypothetical protein
MSEGKAAFHVFGYLFSSVQGYSSPAGLALLALLQNPSITHASAAYSVVTVECVELGCFSLRLSATLFSALP